MSNHALCKVLKFFYECPNPLSPFTMATFIFYTTGKLNIQRVIIVKYYD